MKPFPNANFPVTITHQIWEEDLSVRNYFEGIYTVCLNHLVEISFIPDVSSIEPNNWSKYIKEDADDISSVVEARIQQIFLSRYSVSSHPLLIDEVYTHKWGVNNVPESIIFYTNPHKLEVFLEELKICQESIPKQLGVKVLDISHYNFVSFILEKIVHADHLSKYEKEMLAI